MFIQTAEIPASSPISANPEFCPLPPPHPHRGHLHLQKYLVQASGLAATGSPEAGVVWKGEWG